MRKHYDFTIDFVGDTALQIKFKIDSIPDFSQLLKKLQIKEVTDTCYAFDCITIYFNPLIVNPIHLKGKVTNIINKIAIKDNISVRNSYDSSARSIEIPFCCCTNCALDWERVEEWTKMKFEDFIRQYISYEYKVLFIGFQPGFPFLEGLPQKLNIPRLSTPRTKVPAGSVGIGGGQTGIYTFSSPGGWNIIGKTTLKLFDFNEGSKLKANDRIKFKINDHNNQTCGHGNS